MDFNKITGVTPKPYQKKILDSVRYLNACGLFLGTGSGKTLMSLMKFNQMPCTNLLVLCPKKVVAQWEDVIRTHTNVLQLPHYKKSATAKKRWAEIEEQVIEHPKYNAVVFGLESFKSVDRADTGFINNDWCIIVDESHKIKSVGTTRNPVKVTASVLALRDKTDKKIILTATPAQKDKGGYEDYYSQLYFLGYLGMSWADFKRVYCIEEKRQFVGIPFPVKVIVGYTKEVEKLRQLLKLTCRYYVPKFTDDDPKHIQVLLDKPKNYNTLNPSSRKLAYTELNIDNISARRIAKKTICTGVLSGHDRFGAQLTYDDNTIKREWLEEFLSNTDEVVMIVYKYNVERDALIQLCKDLEKRYIVIDGQEKNKYELIQKYDYDVVIGQFNACGESIDGLQKCCHICVFYCLPESSIEYSQTLGRINRVGQEYLPMYYYPICKGTIEEDIWDMLQSKKTFNEKVLNELAVNC